MSKPECKKCGDCRRCCMVARSGGQSIATILNGDGAAGAWNCANCWMCVDSCPEGVDIYQEMLARRRDEEAPASYRRSYENIRRTGYSMPVEDINTIREMWGLGEIHLADPEKIAKLLPPGGKNGQKNN